MWEEDDGVNQRYRDNERGTSSKDSSYVFVDSSNKGSPAVNKGEEAAEAKDSDPKTGEDLNYKTLKMVMEQQQRTRGLVFQNATKDRGNTTTEEDKLDQDDQRIKVVELEKLEI